VVWKDADPAWRALLGGDGQHRNARCLAVKADPARLARCIASDDLTAADWAPGAAPRLRTCPFGVSEVLAPVWGAAGYQGCIFIGPWHRGRAAPGLGAFPGTARALAIARLAGSAFAELCERRRAALAEARARRAGDERMAAAVAWIDAHLDAGLGARQAALAAGLSPSRFIHRFKEATGIPFGVHVRQRLMQEAARLLADPARPVAEVSRALGFASQNWFATAFRRHHGATPTAWRRRLPRA
jgi:AraC-like DNA-binding protein